MKTFAVHEVSDVQCALWTDFYKKLSLCGENQTMGGPLGI